MNVTQNKTEPEIRSIVVFTIAEAKQALKAFATKKGFAFDCSAKDLFIWFPDERMNPISDRKISIGIDRKGIVPAICEPEEQEKENEYEISC